MRVRDEDDDDDDGDEDEQKAHRGRRTEEKDHLPEMIHLSLSRTLSWL